MAIHPVMQLAEAGKPIRAADIRPAQEMARAFASLAGDGMSVDGVAASLIRASRRVTQLSMVRVLGRSTAEGADALWECEEVRLRAKRGGLPGYEWVQGKRASKSGHGLLWLADMHDDLGRRGSVHARSIVVPALQLYTADTVRLWVGIPMARSVQHPFVARVASAVVLGPNRWTYTVREVERRGPASVGVWADAAADAKPGRVVLARNLAEENNSATGVQGHGVNISAAGFPAGFSTQRVPDGSIVMVYPVTVQPGLAGAVESTEWVFERMNGLDGTC